MVTEKFLNMRQIQQAEETVESARDTAAESVIDIRNLQAYYGEHRAVKDVSLSLYARRVSAIIGPSRLRQEHAGALPQPHARDDARRQRGGRGALPGREHLRRGRGSRGASQPHRHGVSEAQPVSQVHLRERGVRAEGERHQRQHRRARGAFAPARPPSGTR